MLRPRSPEEVRKRRERKAAREAERLQAELRRAKALEAEHGRPLITDWEREFHADLAGRLSEEGRGYYDPEKADPADPKGPLSFKQAGKRREIRRLLRERLSGKRPLF